MCRYVPLFALLYCVSAAADVVELQNGDRINGRVIHKRGATLVFEAAQAGKVSIPWKNVRMLTSDDAVAVMLRDSSAVSDEVLGPAVDGQLLLRGSGRTVALGDIAYLNPGPEQSGIGVAYHGRVNLMSSNTRGNTTGRRLYAEGTFAARSRDYRYNLGAKIDRQQEASQQTASNWRIEGNYDWFLNPRTFRYVRSTVERDRFRDIGLRSTLGGGYGLQLIETARSTLSIRGGVDYVRVDRMVDADDDYPAFGWALHASHQLDTLNLELFHNQDGYARLAGGSDMTIRTRTGLRAPITAGMNASIQLNLDWDKNPAPDRAATDSTLLVGLGYAW